MWIYLCTVALYFWYIYILGWAIAGHLATAIVYKFKLPTYIQEPLVTGRRGYLQRDLNGETVSSW